MSHIYFDYNQNLINYAIISFHILATSLYCFLYLNYYFWEYCYLKIGAMNCLVNLYFKMGVIINYRNLNVFNLEVLEIFYRVMVSHFKKSYHKYFNLEIYYDLVIFFTNFT